MTRTLSILGSTGSIGTQALSLTEALGIKITALSGYANTALLEEQALRFLPECVAAVDENAARDLKIKLAHTPVKVLSGRGGLIEIASRPGSDTVLNAVVGIAGLEPTLAAVSAKKKIALANKETLVAGGRIVMDAVKKNGVEMIPVDSEHSAIFQCLGCSGGQDLSRIFLTASGGPFFGKTKAELAGVTAADALKHPNWKMGNKITIDSATLMNKGLELIEAMWLFSAAPEQIEVTVHRQSIVHSMVEFADRSVIAQLGVPDMRIPIQYALTYPERKPSPAAPLTVEAMSSLTFTRPDYDTFDCLAAAIRAAGMGGTAPAAANAANERAVELFLSGRIPFLAIGELVSRAVAECRPSGDESLEAILAADRAARQKIDCWEK